MSEDNIATDEVKELKALEVILIRHQKLIEEKCNEISEIIKNDFGYRDLLARKNNGNGEVPFLGDAVTYEQDLCLYRCHQIVFSLTHILIDVFIDEKISYLPYVSVIIKDFLHNTLMFSNEIAIDKKRSANEILSAISGHLPRIFDSLRKEYC